LNAVSVIFSVARADFLERIRSYSFLATLLAAIYLGYAAATGKVVMSLDEYRGVYTAGWIGLMVALVTTTFVSLIGFYIVKNAVERDRFTRVGQILAATPLSKPAYMLGKFLSNFAVLASIVLVLALGAVAMFFVAAEDPHFRLWALLSPFILIALPAMALTAALALFFENVRFLRGGFGNVVWFFGWGFAIGLPDILKMPRLDPLGLIGAMNSLVPIARELIPGYKNGIALTVAGGHAKIAENLHFAGISWNSESVLLRLVWVGVAIIFTLFAAAIFDRFDEARSWFPAGATKEPKNSAAVAETTPEAAAVPELRKFTQVHLTPLDRTTDSGGFVRIFRAELRLALQGNRWWWYVVAAGLIVAQMALPLGAARGPALQFAWLWPTLLWSSLGARESRFATRQILFSCANILPRQLLACWLAGVSSALLMSGVVFTRLLLARDASAVLALLAGAAFVPSLGLALGIVSGSSKFFEGFYTALWYVGPLNHSPGLDFTGASNGPRTLHYAAIYALLAVTLLGIAYIARSCQLRDA